MVARSLGAGSSIPWPLIGIFIALGVIGIVLLILQRMKRRHYDQTTATGTQAREPAVGA